MTSRLIHAIMAQMGRKGAAAQSLADKRKGGRASADRLTPEERVARARHARAALTAKQAARRKHGQ